MSATDPETTTAPSEEAPEPVRHEKVPSALDLFGRGVEPVRPESAEAAAQWDETTWQRVS